MNLFVQNLLLKKTDRTHLQLFRYTLVGGLAFVVDIGLLYILTEYAHVYYLVAACISFISGLLINYVLTKKIIFTESGPKSRIQEFLFVGIISIIGLGINEALIWYITDHIGLYYIYSKLFAAIIVYMWNFFMRKYTVYR